MDIGRVIAHHWIDATEGVAIADEQDGDRRRVGEWRTGKRRYRNRQHSGKETIHDTLSWLKHAAGLKFKHELG